MDALAFNEDSSADLTSCSVEFEEPDWLRQAEEYLQGLRAVETELAVGTAPHVLMNHAHPQGQLCCVAATGDTAAVRNLPNLKAIDHMVRNQVESMGHRSGGLVAVRQSDGQVHNMPDTKMTMQQMKNRELAQLQGALSQQVNDQASPTAALGQQAVNKQSRLTTVDLAALDPLATLMNAQLPPRPAAAAPPPLARKAPVVSVSPPFEPTNFGEDDSAAVAAAVEASRGPNEKLVAAAAAHRLPVPCEPPPPPPAVSPPPALPPQTLAFSSTADGDGETRQVLQEMFPTIKDHVIAAALVRSTGNPEAAASLLLEIYRREERQAEMPQRLRFAQEPAQPFQASSVAGSHERPLQAMTPAFYNAPEARIVGSRRLTGEKPSWAKATRRLTGSVTGAVEAARVKAAKHRVRKYGHVA